MKKLPELHVGMRNFKTALAIFLCLLIYQFIPGDAAYACIAALITMQSTLEESFEHARNRVVGTIIGGAFGATFWSLNIAQDIPLLRLLAVSAGVTILILFCNLLGNRGAIVMGCVTYLAIVLATRQENFWLYSLLCVLNGMVGILTAMSVNMLIRPPKRRPEQQEQESLEDTSQAQTILGDAQAQDAHKEEDACR